MQRRRKNLLIFGHYGLPNWGDEAILSGLLVRLNPKKWNIRVISAAPEFTKKHHGIKSVFPPPAGLRSFWKALWGGKLHKMLQPIHEADFILFGGGGLFQEQPKKALRIWSWYLRICRFFGKKILLVANSIGPFRSCRTFRKTAKLFQAVSFFSVRDMASEQLLESMEIPKQKIHLTTDAALFLPQQRSIPAKKDLILISLRGEDTSNEMLSVFQEYIAGQQKKGRAVEFLSMQSRQSSDNQIAERLSLSLFVPQNLEELRQKIARSTLLLSSRLHPCILAMLSATPFLAFPARTKIVNFLESCGLTEFLLPLNPNISELKKRTEFVLKNKKSVQLKFLAASQQEKLKTKYLLPDFF